MILHIIKFIASAPLFIIMFTCLLVLYLMNKEKSEYFLAYAKRVINSF